MGGENGGFKGEGPKGVAHFLDIKTQVEEKGTQTSRESEIDPQDSAAIVGIEVEESPTEPVVESIERAEAKAIPNGWFTLNAAHTYLGYSRSTIAARAEKYKISHPEWFRANQRYSSSSAEIYHPELISLIRDEFDKLPKEHAPDGWMSETALSQALRRSPKKVQLALALVRTEHPEFFGIFLDKVGRDAEYISPQILEIIKESIVSNRDLGPRRELVEAVPEGWMTRDECIASLQISERTFQRRTKECRNSHPEWIKRSRLSDDRLVECYSPDLILEFKKIFDDQSSEGWVSPATLAEIYKIPLPQIYQNGETQKLLHPEWFSANVGRLPGRYHPDLVKLILERNSKRKVAPAGWSTLFGAAEKLGSSRKKLATIFEKYRVSNPEWFKDYWTTAGHAVHFHPRLIEEAEKELASRPELPPEGWLTLYGVSKEIQETRDWVESTVSEYRTSNPEWFRHFTSPFANRVEKYLHPDLIARIRLRLEADRRTVDVARSRHQLEVFVKEINEGNALEKGDFDKLVVFCGASRATDILFRFRPEYKSIPVDQVKAVLAEYLGDFLAVKRPFELKDIAPVAEYFSDLTLKEGLFETLKQHCLSFYYEEQKKGKRKDDRKIIDEYLDRAVKELGDLKNKDIDDVVEHVVTFFDKLFLDVHRPEQMVEKLAEGRGFPDVNQRINYKELSEKKRLLIADEMGLGKSGSVIFAKEALGVRQAVLIVPSNVAATWKKYLSDKPEDGGYFQPGFGPSVLEVGRLEELSEDVSQYDYIILSQERLSKEGYVEELKKLDIGMLVVDEMHLLKNLEGKRAQQLVELSQKIEGDDKYLALLSGTPVPNTVKDIAMTLKLLYPEKFGVTDDNEMIRQIVRGDMLDLRGLLLPRMQMKQLRESVEMPELREHLVEVDLNEKEQEAYELLLEEDELTATQKMQVLRQFLLNPELVDPTPGIESSKIRATSEALKDIFVHRKSAVLFVNGFVEGVMRGENNILDKLDLGSDVEIVSVHGKVSMKERDVLQKRLRETPRKLLLVVSGQTAGVGVDFSAAEGVLFYNEPWTEFDRRQQLGRVYRPGLEHDLKSTTLIARGTIEEGIHRHVLAKYQAIEKLLRGIPLTELEQDIVTKSENEDQPGADVNPELARYYFSAWERMMKIFAHVKELGEPDFEKFLERFSREYAECYLELGTRSYQANANRVSGTIISKLVREGAQEKETVRILDVASGPEMLRRHIADGLEGGVVSMDLNAEHFAQAGERRIVGSYLHMPIAEKSFDYANLALAWHYTSFVPSQEKFERLEVLQEMNRVLKEGGKAVLNHIYSLDLKDEVAFERIVGLLGFRIISEVSGDAEKADTYASRVTVLEKLADVSLSTDELVAKLRELKLIDGLKFRQNKKRLRDSRGVITSFLLNGNDIPVELNEVDKAIRAEEQQIFKDGEVLKNRFGGIQEIPKSEVIESGFNRIFNGKRYVLFRKLTKGPGAVVVR